MLALCDFETGAQLPDHAAKGFVTIHVFEGALEVTAAGETHRLQSAQALVLAPNLRHSVRALDRSAMLLCVCFSAE